MGGRNPSLWVSPATSQDMCSQKTRHGSRLRSWTWMQVSLGSELEPDTPIQSAHIHTYTHQQLSPGAKWPPPLGCFYSSFLRETLSQNQKAKHRLLFCAHRTSSLQCQVHVPHLAWASCLPCRQRGKKNHGLLFWLLKAPDDSRVGSWGKEKKSAMKIVPEKGDEELQRRK